MIYLDHNATTPLAPAVLEAMRPYLEKFHGNPSSIHAAGRETRAAIDDSRDRLAALLRCRPHEIIFTGGGTESNNLALLGLARAHASGGKHLITCATEHHAVLHPLEHLQRHEGFRLTVLGVDSRGLLDPADVRRALTPETTLVSVMTANNETGIRQPVAEITAHCRGHGVLFHTDAIQSFGKEPLACDADALSLAAHKFYGPKGAGLLCLRGGISVERIAFGGSHESERRPGTENVAAIVGMARAAELAVVEIEAEAARQVQLRERLWEGIRAAFPAAVRNSDPALSLANTLNVSFPGLDGESLLINLDLAGICASSGSACMVGSIQPSHVLLAMGVPREIAQATVRFSLGKLTAADEIEEAIRRITGISERLHAAESRG
ncbi:MAG: cysteine desulfurase family protein [Chthoniobacteraceae bacterium]